MGSYSVKKDALPLKAGKREVPLEMESERRVVFLRISFDCICIHVCMFM